MPPSRARLRLRRRQGGGRPNGQARMNEAIFAFALSAAAALVQLSSPSALAGHHSKSKAIYIFSFSVLASFCTAIISMTLSRRRRPQLVRASSRLAAFSAAVAFSSVTSMVLPRTLWWAAYVACALPLFNLCREMQRMKASLQKQNPGVEIIAEV